MVKAALRPLGTVWFGGVAMQPGKPQGYGRVDGDPIFTLPGNPVSRDISFQVFVLPALRRMMGREPPAVAWPTARLAEPIRLLARPAAAVLRGVLRDGELHSSRRPGFPPDRCRWRRPIATDHRAGGGDVAGRR